MAGRTATTRVNPIDPVGVPADAPAADNGLMRRFRDDITPVMTSNVRFPCVARSLDVPLTFRQAAAWDRGQWKLLVLPRRG